MIFQWWRSWHDAPMDHKWSVIAARAGVKAGIVSAIAWALFDYASQHTKRGTVEGFDTEVYSVFSCFPEDVIKAVIQAMTDKGIIVNGRLANWEKRQPKREDDSSARVRKHRELKRSVTQCNANNEIVTIDSNLNLNLNLNSLNMDEENMSEISKVFSSLTGIIPYKLDQWDEASQTLCRAGITPENITDAISKLKEEGMPVTGLWSITKTAIGIHAGRNNKSGNKKESAIQRAFKKGDSSGTDNA